MANSGYIPDDASFGAYTFQVLSSRLKPGCAESAIDDGLLDLILANDKNRQTNSSTRSYQVEIRQHILSRELIGKGACLSGNQ